MFYLITIQILNILPLRAQCDYSDPKCLFIKHEKVSLEQLHKSQPDPVMFGNPKGREEYWTQKNWLTKYYNPNNTNFGVLRVLNDDIIQAQRGFGKHPHKEVEIISYIVYGELTHKDSMGSKETIYADDIQIIQAGTGIQHQEANTRSRAPCRLIQSWVKPRKYGQEPNYYSVKGISIKNNTFTHLVGDILRKGPQLASIDQDLNLFVAKFTEEQTFLLKKKRQVYILCVEGPINIILSSEQTVNLKTGEALKVWGRATLKFWAQTYGHVLVFEMSQ